MTVPPVHEIGWRSAILSAVESQPPELSVVVPVYNCEDCLRHLHARLKSSRAALGTDYELVFVDARGADRHFGQATAITAGLANTRGSHVVVTECDLQDRPEDIDTSMRRREGATTSSSPVAQVAARRCSVGSQPGCTSVCGTGGIPVFVDIRADR